MEASRSGAPAPPGAVHVLPAPPGAAWAVQCCIWRTIAAGAPAALASTVHANTFACLNIVAEGRVRLADGTDLPPLFVTGPFAAPVATFADAPLRSLSIAFHPWLLPAWFGLSPRVLAGAAADAGDLPGRAQWRSSVAPLLLAAAREPDRIGVALEALCAGGPQPAPALEALLWQAGSVQGAARAAGMPVRRFHRHFLESHGLAPARWLQLRRFEESLVRMAAPGSALAHAAADAGYADQAHMSRAFRASADATPREARRALAEGAPRLWSLLGARAGGR